MSSLLSIVLVGVTEDGINLPGVEEAILIAKQETVSSAEDEP